MNIKNLTGHITNTTDLSPTAKEVTITLTEPITFQAGAFVNLFVEDEGETIRRAFSISSDPGTHPEFTLSIRRSKDGRLSPLFWEKDMIGQPVKIMGPLGLNTADKMTSQRVFLFGFGIGVGVVKSLASHFSKQPDITSLVIMTGNRDNADVMYRDYFDELEKSDKRILVRRVVTNNDGSTDFPVGYIQDHIDDFNFDDADIYICGQGVACNALQEKIEASKPTNHHFFVEDFH